jgi:hypothetical protein
MSFSEILQNRKKSDALLLNKILIVGNPTNSKFRNLPGAFQEAENLSPSNEVTFLKKTEATIENVRKFMSDSQVVASLYRISDRIVEK